MAKAREMCALAVLKYKLDLYMACQVIIAAA